jgi:hypothetical protein
MRQRIFKESLGQIDYGSQPHTGVPAIAWRRGKSSTEANGEREPAVKDDLKSIVPHILKFAPLEDEAHCQSPTRSSSSWQLRR